MARGKRDDTLPLHNQVRNALQKKNGYGRSKHEDKASGLTSEYIYSISTMQTYMKHCNYFVEWCKKNMDIKKDIGHFPKTLEECFPYVEAWIRSEEEKNISNYTLKMQKAALSKMYGVKINVTLNRSKRTDIKRSRNDVKRDAHFSKEKNWDLINACKHVGFRRDELRRCSADDLFEKDGQYFVRITGKGGKYREALVLDNDRSTIDFILSLNGKNRIHNGADIHSYRADYATEIYKKYAKPIEVLKNKNIDYTLLTGKRTQDGSRIYKSAICYGRNDHKGLALDREAMLRASQALGHNREDVFANHYIRL